jgi:hypothetical protein
MKTVWILFSIANDYNQPPKAYENIWWHKPTFEDLKEYGYSKKQCTNIAIPIKISGVEYWVESFSEPVNK